MRKLTLSPAVLFVVLFFVSNVFGQEGLKMKEEERKFSFSLQTGLTLHTDYLINDDYSWNGIGVNYFEGGVFYKITDKVELGATIGRDNFKITGSGTSIDISPQGDTTISSYSFSRLNPYTWIAGNVNYYFNNKFSAGIKVGGSDGAFYLSGNFGAQLLNSEDWGLNSIVQLSTRFLKENSNFNTYQINFLFNVRFKPDLTGIF